MGGLSPTYAVRGFLAFVAFMEFVNALRSLMPSLFALPHESESFVQSKIFSQTQLSKETNLIVGQLFGFYSLLNSGVLVHAALFSHLLPLLSLGILCLVCKCSFYILQGCLLDTIPKEAYQVPLLISLLALTGLLFLLWVGDDTVFWGSADAENEALLKAMKFGKAKKKKAL